MLSIKTNFMSCILFYVYVLKNMFTNCCCKNTTEHLTTIIKFKPIPAHNGCYILPKFKEPQGFADSDRLGKLSNNGDGKYRLELFVRDHYSKDDLLKSKIITPNGKYDFVISKNDNKIYCYVRTKEHPHSEILYNKGHYAVSFVFNSELTYAGGIIFDRGELMQWSNASGHYKPNRDTHLIVFNNCIKALIPNNKFQPLRW